MPARINSPDCLGEGGRGKKRYACEETNERTRQKENNERRDPARTRMQFASHLFAGKYNDTTSANHLKTETENAILR